MFLRFRKKQKVQPVATTTRRSFRWVASAMLLPYIPPKGQNTIKQKDKQI